MENIAENESAQEAQRARGALAALQDWRKYLPTKILSREKEIDAGIAGLISGQHMCLLGPPGEGKSMLARALGSIVQPKEGNGYFEYLFTRYTEPKELFGPPDIKAMKEHGIIRHAKNPHTLQSANVAFCDEAFKANSGILNSLLGILNERHFNNGPSREEVPLLFAILASNEYPEDDCSALWDRCLIRFEVTQPEMDVVFDIACRRVGATVPKPTAIAAEDILFLREASEEVTVSEECRQSLEKLSDLLAKKNISVSTRRWAWSLSYLRAWAVLDGAAEVDASFLTHLENVLWEKHEQLADVIAAIKQVTPANLQKEKIDALLKRFNATVTEFSAAPQTARMPAAAKARSKIEALRKEMNKLLALIPKASAAGNQLRAYIERADNMNEELKRVFLKA